MESFFHGKSSGLDPLNSYLSLPILINSKTNIEPAGIPSQKEGKGAVFLLDSEQVGETEPMVNIFMNKMKNEGFRKMLNEEFSKYVRSMRSLTYSKFESIVKSSDNDGITSCGIQSL